MVPVPHFPKVVLGSPFKNMAATDSATEPAMTRPILKSRAPRRAPLQPIGGNTVDPIAAQKPSAEAGPCEQRMFVIPDSILPGGEWSTGSWYGDWPDGFNGRALKRYEGKKARAARKAAEAAVNPCQAVAHRDAQLLEFVSLLRTRIGDERAVGLLQSLWMAALSAS